MSRSRKSGSNRLATRLTTRLGAATFVTGSALAGPQGLGIAGADASGKADSSSGTATSQSSNAQRPADSARRTATAGAAARGPAGSSSAKAPAATAGPRAAAASTAAAAETDSTKRIPRTPHQTVVPSAASTTPPVAAASGNRNLTPHAGQAAQGSVLAIFVSNGTLSHPNAGILIGNGFSFDAITCATGVTCDGGRAGLLFGNDRSSEATTQPSSPPTTSPRSISCGCGDRWPEVSFARRFWVRCCTPGDSFRRSTDCP